MTLRADLDRTFVEVHSALRRKDWPTLDRMLEAFDFEHADLELAVTVLMATKPARENIAARSHAVERLKRRIETEMPERAKGILRWL